LNEKMKINILKANRSDLQAILELQYSAYQSEAIIYNDFALPPLTQPLSEVQQEYEKGVFLKAVNENGVIIGAVRAFPNGDTTKINKLIVRPDKQGQGIGTKLLLAIESECPSTRYELFTGHKSARNIKLYERLGYARFKEEKVSDERTLVYMEKRIGTADREENLMATETNIYRHAAKVYDIIYGIEQPMPDIPFYREYAKQQCGENGERGEYLELGCGTGRVALPLARDGFRVTGLDLSQQMLDIFKENLAKEEIVQPGISDRVEVIHGNMAEFSIGRKFALITAPFRAFQAVTAQKDIENVFACVREHLTDDGIFIVNVFNPYANPLDESWCREEVYIGEVTDDATGIRVAKYECREKIDPVNQVIYPYLAYGVTYPDGRTERLVEPLQMKYYYSPQLRTEVEKAGLVVAEEFSWYDKSPPSGKEIILLCRRER